jgi:transcriptional regulator with XRE-family HTH domain
VIDILPRVRDCEAMHKESPDEMYREFGSRVRVHRLKQGLGQADVATHLGLTRASISNLEAGRQRPLLHQVLALAAILDTTFDALVPTDLYPPTFDPDRERHEDIERRLLAAAGQSR